MSHNVSPGCTVTVAGTAGRAAEPAAAPLGAESQASSDQRGADDGDRGGEHDHATPGEAHRRRDALLAGLVKGGDGGQPFGFPVRARLRRDVDGGCEFGGGGHGLLLRFGRRIGEFDSGRVHAVVERAFYRTPDRRCTSGV